MVETNGDPVPAQPPHIGVESHGQRAATATEKQSLVATAGSVGEYLGANLQQSFSGLLASHDKLTFTHPGVAALNAAIGMLESGRDIAVRERDAERAAREVLEERAHAAELRASVAETQLRNATAESDRKLLMSGIGCVLLGLIPFAYDKMQVAGSIVAAALGAALVIGAARIGKTRSGN
jgi:hypothetical protein